MLGIWQGSMQREAQGGPQGENCWNGAKHSQGSNSPGRN